ncbi:site-specific integrase [Desulfoplanes sp.]
MRNSAQFFGVHAKNLPESTASRQILSLAQFPGNDLHFFRYLPKRLCDPGPVLIITELKRDLGFILRYPPVSGKLAILLTAEHGASKQEILDPRWDDIDFDLGDSGYIGFYRTKNEVQRMHPLQMERTREALLARRKYLAKYRKIAVEEVDGYVVGHPDGRPMLDICSAWRTIRKNAGMPEFHFHDLRHIFCTNLIFSGRTLPQTQKLIGHKTAKMTERYSHFEIMEEFTGFRDLSQRYKTGA